MLSLVWTVYCSHYFSHGSIEIEDPRNGITLKVNGQQLRPYLEHQPHKGDTKISLSDPLDPN